MFPVVSVISFSPLYQQLLRFSPLGHVTEITCHLFRSVQFGFEERNFESGSGIKALLSFAIAIYCLTKISIRAKRSISRVFSLFIVPSPFSCTLPVQRPY